MNAHSLAGRDAALVVVAVVVLIFVGSGGFAHLDHALSGYLLATLVAAGGVAFKVSSFWRRPPSALYGGVLARGLMRPNEMLQVARTASTRIVAQTFIRERSRRRWFGHMLLAWGTLASFAITLPLVWGLLRFEAVSEQTYRVVVFSIPTVSFAIDGPIGFGFFHALLGAGIAVAVGSLLLLLDRFERRHEAEASNGFHWRPLALLLVVALTGILLPIVGQLGSTTAFRAAQLAHEAAVVGLLVALPFGKLQHLFIRPLQLGAKLMAATSTAAAVCTGCGEAFHPSEQVLAVQNLLRERGFAFAGRPGLCPTCRRRELATAHCHGRAGRFRPAGADLSSDTMEAA